MKTTFFWLLSSSIILVTIALISLMNYLIDETELNMSFIKQEHQQELLNYGLEAEKLYLSGDTRKLEQWLIDLQEKESTWIAIVQSSLDPILGTEMDPKYMSSFVLGRGVTWKVHLYFDLNPVMDLPFVDKNTHFLIRLPERMRPGAYWKHTDLLLKLAVPLLPLLLLTLLIYRYLMSPLQRLKVATKKFSEGDLKARVRPSLGHRNDELTELADVFDQMANNTSDLIIKQRQLIADLSHELRTPITRMELAIGGAKQGIAQTELIPRLEKEARELRTLVEDTLTLAWLENEKPSLQGEEFNLIELIEIILEDAKFEFPNAQFITQFPKNDQKINCNQRALGQALENLIRNALKYSPIEKPITIAVEDNSSNLVIKINDLGKGVPEELLESIFQPFFRVDKSRDKRSDGFGLGLALARRQVEAMSGRLKARNSCPGLEMNISLPYSYLK
ncbi:histidine kinase sensor domain-containing protein [Vibrio sp. RC27]